MAAYRPRPIVQAALVAVFERTPKAEPAAHKAGARAVVGRVFAACPSATLRELTGAAADVCDDCSFVAREAMVVCRRCLDPAFKQQVTPSFTGP